MENTKPTKKLIWKLGVPATAIILVVGIIIYTGGYGNFLKLLGIKASELQTFELTSQDQFLGNGVAGSLLVPGSVPVMTGVSALNGSDLVPADPGTDVQQGIVMSLYSSDDPTSNAYPDHSYVSATIDFGSTSPTLSSLSLMAHLPASASLENYYRTSDSVAGIETAEFVPVELAVSQEDSDPKTLSQLIDAPVKQFFQIKVVIVNDSFAERAAIYSWTIQYDQNIVPADDTNPNPGDSDVINTEPALVTLDLSNTQNLPDILTIQVLTSTALGSQSVQAQTNLPTDDITPLYNLPTAVAPGHYALVLRARGMVTQVMAFEVISGTPLTIPVPNFSEDEHADPTFDLNGDGAVNSLDLSILIQHYGVEAVPPLDNN